AAAGRRQPPPSRRGALRAPEPLARAAHALPDPASLRHVRRADQSAHGTSFAAGHGRRSPPARRSPRRGPMTAFGRLVDRIAARYGSLGVTVELWDGTRRTFGAGSEGLVIRLRGRRACLGLLANPSLRFGDAYVDGAIEVEGDLGRLMELLLGLTQRDAGASLGGRFLDAARSWAPRNSPFRARKNARYHYDLGNEFFRLWLGRTMAYSCAYFREPTDDLDTAQEQKFRHVCEKLRLEPGLTLLDIGRGCGRHA